MLVITFIILLGWALSILFFLYNLSGFIAGETYDYTNRRKTYHGRKTIAWFVAIYILYHLPYEEWGLFYG